MRKKGKVQDQCQILIFVVLLCYALFTAEKFMEACSINVHAKKDQAPQIIAANPLDELDCKHIMSINLVGL